LGVNIRVNMRVNVAAGPLGRFVAIAHRRRALTAHRRRRKLAAQTRTGGAA